MYQDLFQIQNYLKLSVDVIPIFLKWWFNLPRIIIACTQCQLVVATWFTVIGSLTTEWLSWLQTSWKDSGYERFTLGYA